LREAGQPKYLAYVNAFRYEFNSVYSDAGSNIDRDVYLASQTELFLYLPRAALIGSFAPFPNLWFSEGKSFGKAGRILAGTETFFIYLLALFALLAVYRNYRSAHVWLIVLSIGVGSTALGLIVTNLGAIYRMRYFFWFLLILLGTEGVVSTLQSIKASNRVAGFKE
jgi:putative peptidoglycan lipid II flippase